MMKQKAGLISNHSSVATSQAAMVWDWPYTESSKCGIRKCSVRFLTSTAFAY